MSAPVFVNAMHLISPAGNGVPALWDRMTRQQSCLKLHNRTNLWPDPFYGSLLSENQWADLRRAAPDDRFTDFEALAYAASHAALRASGADLSRTALVLSTTKGNIAQLNELPDERITLHHSANLIGTALGIAKSLVVSQACISGLSAILYGARLLQSHRYDQVVVTGADVVSQFVLSGFQSFHAVAKAPCKPFDVARAGINLGEAAATVVLSRSSRNALARMAGGGSSNDANHISGPSRTGEELAMAIQAALQEANLKATDLDAISAHGTATIYNDEMESRAFARLGLSGVPLHSAKGATGHTLGAAGVLESILAIQCIQQQTMLPSLGFQTLGVPEPVTVCTETRHLPIRQMLKTASGFGGSNAALIWQAMD